MCGKGSDRIIDPSVPEVPLLLHWGEVRFRLNDPTKVTYP